MNAVAHLSASLMLLLALACGRAGTPSPPPLTKPEVAPVVAARPPVPAPAPAPVPAIGGSRAGSWYPSDTAKARKMMEDFLNLARQAPLDQVVAVITPHAGWRYSGGVAAHAYQAVYMRRVDRVIVLAPSHYAALGNTAVLTDAVAYATPLGDVRLDAALATTLAREERFRIDDEVVAREHALEIQMPWIRRSLGDVPVLPVILGRMDREAVRALAARLKELVTNETLVVVSSDFTHYGPNYSYLPFTEAVASGIKKLDFGALGAIEARDADRFWDYRAETGATICGFVPITILLDMLPDNTRVKLLKYDTSGNMTGDHTNSVSYLSVAIEGAWRPDGDTFSKDRWTLSRIDPVRKRLLLALARKTIKVFLEEGRVIDPRAEGFDIDPMLEERAGAFVTLKKQGILRGCIGEIPPRRPLVEVVIDHAIDAAVHDRRFQPVRADELAELNIEISILTPPRPIASHKEIRIGKDGVLLIKGQHRAVYLPQVAPEQGWDVETTLSHLSKKAGLAPNGWREGAQFQVFQAIVFEEHD